MIAEQCREAEHPDTPPERLSFLAGKNRKLKRAVARNPNAPPELLRKLAERSEDQPTFEALARNPATPPDLLKRIARRCPREFLENPALPLLLLEDPGLFEAMPEASQLALFSAGGLPEAVLARLVASEDASVRSVLAARLTGQPALLARLAGDGHSGVRCAAAKNVDTPGPLLAKLAEDRCAEVRAAVAKNPKTPRWLLDFLARDGDEIVRRLAGGAPGPQPSPRSQRSRRR